MPIPQTIRINPLDLQPNVAIGVSIPFNGAAVFNSTYSTKDQIKSNLINLLLTDQGERVMNPNFGSNLKRDLFEFITDDNIAALQQSITDSISQFIPQIQTTNISITQDQDNHIVNVTVSYSLVLSGTKDQIQIQFQ